jgi:hypothetical protein
MQAKSRAEATGTANARSLLGRGQQGDAVRQDADGDALRLEVQRPPGATRHADVWHGRGELLLETFRVEVVRDEENEIPR